MTIPPAGDAPVLVWREGAAGIIRLNRPKAINALTVEMDRIITDALIGFEADPAIGLVLVEGAGDRGFCAGGDIRGLYDSSLAGGDLGKTFWSEEYALNARIAEYPKPYVAFMDGIVMGGGVGLSAHGSHRIATDRTRLAMPETGIGFFPDVGGTWLLSRSPGEIGTYFGLVGHAMNGADAVHARLADSVIAADQWPELRAALLALGADAGHDGVRAVIKRFAVPSPWGPAMEQQVHIDRLFAHHTAEEIVAALERDGTEFAQETLTMLRAKSPTAVKVTLRLLREARRSASLEECLVREYRAALEVFVSREFIEGVRAAIIDKDRNPKWVPSRIEDVTPDIVARYFVDRGADELVFAN